jgi:hypothetical protein
MDDVASDMAGQCRARLDQTELASGNQHDDGASASPTVTVSGFQAGPGMCQALHDIGRQHQTLVEHNPAATPPHPRPLLRLQLSDGTALCDAALIRKYWHQPPYAMAIQLVSYAPYSASGTVIDSAVIGTRGNRRIFESRLERTVARLVEAALAGTSSGATAVSFNPAQQRARWLPFRGSLDHLSARWRSRLFIEKWGVGLAAGSLASIAQSAYPGPVRWLAPGKGGEWLADPFPCPGSGFLLCEKMPARSDCGVIVAIAPQHDGSWEEVSTLLSEAGTHFSYPCTFREGGETYVIPEALEQGGTTLYRLTPEIRLIPVCTIAPGRRLADPTLFRHQGRYWIACTDVDIGEHDNLCLLHAQTLDGPWQLHRCTPVKIDICGARPAGPLFRIGNTLFRPGQDCARTYGAAVVIHRVEMLTPDCYRETFVSRLSPDPSGEFPDGLHTLAADEAGRVWLDGKRFEFDFATLCGKILRRAANLSGVGRSKPA